MKYILGLLCVFALFSCEDTPEPILGCTDAEAENYNPNATESDNNCVYAREAFLGDFTGTITCGFFIPDPSPFKMSVSEGLVGNNTVVIEISETPTPFPIVDGMAKGDSLLIPQSTYMLEVLGEPRDVDISGSAVYADNETTLNGLMKIQADISGTVVTDNCVFEATK